MSTPAIRRTTLADVEALACLRRADAIERMGVPPDADPDFDTRFATWTSETDNGSVGWLAETGGQPVGMLHMLVHARMPIPHRQPGSWAYINALYVRPRHRNAGLGRRLLDAALDYANAHEIRRVLLHPSERAVPFYSRAGLRPADPYLLWTADRQQVR